TCSLCRLLTDPLEAHNTVQHQEYGEYEQTYGHKDRERPVGDEEHGGSHAALIERGDLLESGIAHQDGKDRLEEIDTALHNAADRVGEFLHKHVHTDMTVLGLEVGDAEEDNHHHAHLGHIIAASDAGAGG